MTRPIDLPEPKPENQHDNAEPRRPRVRLYSGRDLRTEEIANQLASCFLPLPVYKHA